MTETNEKSRSALKTYMENLRRTPARLRESLFRHDRPDTDRARSQAVFANLFLHLHSTRIRERNLQFWTTCGLGTAALASFILLTVTGILLMIYYKPTTDMAYQSIKDIHFIVPTGLFIRNIHRWAAHLMVILVFLHMARVFYTSAYKNPREFNWLIGMALLVLTLGLSFTGYLLPWDQLAYWAITIGSNIAQSPRELTDALGMTAFFDPGGLQKRLLLGADNVGQEALTRFYLLHVIVLPLFMAGLIGVHFWRVRKDGGLASPPGEPSKPARLLTGQEVSSARSGENLWPHGAREGQDPARGPRPRKHRHLVAECFLRRIGRAYGHMRDLPPVGAFPGCAAQGNRKPDRAGKSGQSAVVLPGPARAGFILRLHGKHRYPDDRAAGLGADPVSGPRARACGRLVVGRGA